jgi:hypothetical protein
VKNTSPQGKGATFILGTVTPAIKIGNINEDQGGCRLGLKPVTAEVTDEIRQWYWKGTR